MDDLQISSAITRILGLKHQGGMVQIDDVVAGLKFASPKIEFTKAMVLQHLATMVANGYQPPVEVIDGWY